MTTFTISEKNMMDEDVKKPPSSLLFSPGNGPHALKTVDPAARAGAT